MPDHSQQDARSSQAAGSGTFVLVSRGLGLVVALLGAAHLVAWLGGWLAPLGAHSVTLKTNAAFSFLLLGVALTFRLSPGSGSAWHWAAGGLASLAALVATLTLSENLFGWDLGIDQLISAEPPGARGVTAPNRMGTPSAIGILLTGIAVLHLWRPGDRAAAMAQRFALPVCLLGMLTSIGYLYGVERLYGVARVSAIAWPGALALLLLGTALLLARPGEGPMHLVSTADPGGALFRRLFFPMLLLPLAAGWLRLFGEREGWFEPALGTALVMLLFVVIFLGLLYSGGRRVSRDAAALWEVQAQLEQLHAQAVGDRERLETVFRRLPAGVVIVEASSGDMVYVNDYAAKIIGSPGDARGRRPESLDPRHPDGTPMTHAEMPMVRALQGETMSGQMMRLPRGEGWIDLSVSAAPLRDPRGNVRQAVIIFEDVTAKRLVEEALARSETQLRAVVENLAEGLIVSSLDGRVRRWNQAALEMHGFGAGEGDGRGLGEVAALFELSTLHGVVLTPDQWPLSRILRGEQLHNWELRIRRRDGDWQRVYSYGGALVRDDAGRPMMAMLTMSDVTERKRAEEDLRRSEEQFRLMFESAAAGITLVDLDGGRFLRVNRQLALLTGYSERELLQGMSIIDLVHPHEKAAAIGGLAKVRSGQPGEPYFVERRYVRKDGEVIDVELHGALLRDPRPPRAVAMFILVDATQRRRVESQLAAAKGLAERARAQAEDASRAKDHFLSVLSHELRTPLSPVLTGVSLLEREAGVSPRGHTVLDVIRRNVELEARLIDDLLDLTRITRGKVELDRRPVDLGTVIERAVEVCQADIETRGLEFGVDYGPRPYRVHADAARLQQVFWNLLKNAIKFTPKGGCLGVRCRPDSGQVVVEVTDSGIGIEPDALDGIFDAFAQAERSITRQFGGLGLGLAISKALVEMHGGAIEARSAGRGRGATFTVRLPLLVAAPRGEARDAQRLAPAAAAHRSLRVLLVEDHGDTAEMMGTVLTLAGHTVRTAGDVGSALDILLDGHEFDLLLSDLGLPDRSGLDLMRELRARGVFIPAIALSGYGQERDIEQSRAVGFSAHLVKPAEPGVLLETMDRVVQKG